MDYQVISADSHIDLFWLPEDLFVSQAPARLKKRMPKVIDTQQGRFGYTTGPSWALWVPRD